VCALVESKPLSKHLKLTPPFFRKNRVITLSDDEPEEADPTRPWLCNICPIVLSDPEQIRVLIPCGHAFCVDCAGNSEYCPICDEAVDAISTPKLQEGEAVDEEEEVSSFELF
jgi:hypothetical protein